MYMHAYANMFTYINTHLHTYRWKYSVYFYYLLYISIQLFTVSSTKGLAAPACHSEVLDARWLVPPPSAAGFIGTMPTLRGSYAKDRVPGSGSVLRACDCAGLHKSSLVRCPGLQMSTVRLPLWSFFELCVFFMAGVRLPGRFVTWNALVASFVASICADFDSTKVVWARNFFFWSKHCKLQPARRAQKTQNDRTFPQTAANWKKP